MDSEDRDHFKTIAGAQGGQQGDSQKPPSGASSASRPSPAYCLKRAEMMFGSYRKDEAQNPEIYAASVAATFEQYPQAVVDFVSDPRTGIASEIKWLPNIAEVREFCNGAAARMARLAQPSVKPRSTRYDSLPPAKYWNLFVGNDIIGYEKMVERASEAAHEYYKYDSNYKGTGRAGIWVPDEWWRERHGKVVRSEAELKPMVVSDELKRQINPAAFVNSENRGGF